MSLGGSCRVVFRLLELSFLSWLVKTASARHCVDQNNASSINLVDPEYLVGRPCGTTSRPPHLLPMNQKAACRLIRHSEPQLMAGLDAYT
jgi:hypothetical protein